MKLIFATHNQHKVEELKKLLPSNISILSLTDINCHEEIEETAGEVIHSDNVSDSTHSVADEIAKLSKLKADGAISEEEFTKMKNDLIDKM